MTNTISTTKDIDTAPEQGLVTRTTHEYRGHVLVIEKWLRPGLSSTSGRGEAAKDADTFFSVKDNGRAYQAPTGDFNKVLKSLKANVDLAIEDAALLPTLVPLIRMVHAGLNMKIITPETAAVGTVAYVCAMGRWRRGVVTKVGKKLITVAYTTANSDGRIYRKASNKVCVARRGECTPLPEGSLDPARSPKARR